MPQRYGPGELISAVIINDILERLERLEAGKQSKEKDAKEGKEKDTKEGKEKDNKEGKETKEKDTKETKEKDTKEGKEKDTKETKEKDTKETKEKDTKETKEKDTKESKDTKDTKEASKDTKESKESKENKENKEEKEEKEQKDRTKENLSLKEKDRDMEPAPLNPTPPAATFGPPNINIIVAGPGAEDAGEAPTARAFIRGDERPLVGRRAIELADKQPEAGPQTKQAEAADR